MKKNLKLLVSSVLVALAFSMPQETYGMDSKHVDQISSASSVSRKQEETTRYEEYEDLGGLLRIELEDAETRKAEEAEQQRLKSIPEAELREKQAIFAIRGTRIEICMAQYRLLGQQLSYGQLDYILSTIINTYQQIITQQVAPGRISPRIANLYFAIEQTRLGIYDMARDCNSNRYDRPVARSSASVPHQIRSMIREDVIESMNLYKQLYGHEHPLWKEFIELIKHEDSSGLLKPLKCQSRAK